MRIIFYPKNSKEPQEVVADFRQELDNIDGGVKVTNQLEITKQYIKYKNEIQRILDSDKTIFIHLNGAHYKTLSRNGNGTQFDDYLKGISKKEILKEMKDLNRRLKNNKETVIKKPKIIKEEPETNLIPKNNPEKEIKIIDNVYQNSIEKIKKLQGMFRKYLNKHKIIKAEDLDKFADAKIQSIGYDEKSKKIKIVYSDADKKI